MPVAPRVLYWPPSPDVLPIVYADGRRLAGRAVVNPPGLDMAVSLDQLKVRTVWSTPYPLQVSPRRQISVVGADVVHVHGSRVHFFDGETGKALHQISLPDTSDGFCVDPSGDAVWVRLLGGDHRRVSVDGTHRVAQRPEGCRDPLRPHLTGLFRVRHDGERVHVEGAGWRWQGPSKGMAGPWPSGAWDRDGERVYVGTLTGDGPGIDVLDANDGQHIRRIRVAAGGAVPQFTLYGDTLIVPRLQRWDLISVETGRKVGQHPDLRR